MNNDTVSIPKPLTKGQLMARLDKYGPEFAFHPHLVNFAETADVLYTRLALSKNREHNHQIRAALSRLSLAVDFTINVLKQDIKDYD